MSVRIAVVDNYDSFVFTQVGYLRELGATVDVVRNDAIGVAGLAGYDGVLLSPGPGHPKSAGICLEAVRWCVDNDVPMLGVCLGHQALAEAMGAAVAHAPELMHGKTSVVAHDGTGVFTGLPNPFTGARYHSLAVIPETVPAGLRVTARTDAGIIMGLTVEGTRVHGVQFHPESIITEHGHLLLANWLVECGDPAAVVAAAGRSPLLTR